MSAIGYLIDPKGPHKALDVDKLRTWSELRHVIQTTVNIIDYQLSENGFAAFLVCDIVLILVLLQGVLLSKNVLAYILSTAALMQLAMVVIISSYMLMVFSTAVKTTKMQRNQIKLLKDQRLCLLYKTMQGGSAGALTATTSTIDSGGPPMSIEQLTKLMSLVDLVIERLEDNDVAPEVIGLPMTPTTYNIFIGYLTSAAAAVVFKLATEHLSAVSI